MKRYLLLLLLLIPVAAGLSTDRQVYLQHDTITIHDAGPLEVFSPTAEYTMIGTADEVHFPASETGTYIFRSGEDQHAVRVVPPRTVLLRSARGAARIQAADLGEDLLLPSTAADRILVRGPALEEIRITEDLPVTWGFERTYAVDPTAPGFGSAKLTYTAQGDSLLKCAEYDYFAQRCDGAWTFLRPLVPGQPYTLTVSGADPAFGEGDGQSQPDTCSFTDDAGAGDGDSSEDCLSEAQVQDDGQTADLQDPESGGGPSQIDIGFSNSLAVAAINAVDVTYRYQRGSNTEVGDTVATIQVFDSGAWTTACTDTVSEGSWESFPCDLSTWVTTEAEVNDIQTRIQFDTSQSARPSGEGTVYVDHAYLAVDYVYDDRVAPSFSNIDTQPASPETYDGSSTDLSADWSDDVALDTVVIEHNFTGALQNATLTGGPTYTHSVTLGAGNYIWRQLANDTSGNRNDSMSYQVYEVTRAPGSVELLVNQSGSDLVMDEDQSIDINGTRLAGETLMTLYENGIPIVTGTDIDLSRAYDTPGMYLLELNMSATQNYSQASQSILVTVEDITPPGPVTGLTNTSAGEGWIVWEWTDPVDPDLSHVIVEVNGTFVENTSAGSSNVTGLMAGMLYEVSLRSVDTAGNINHSAITDLGRTLQSFDITPPVISNARNGSVTDSDAHILWDTDEAADSVVKYGTSSGSYPQDVSVPSSTTSHDVLLDGLSPSTTYYYVVNSTDPAGNSNQSGERSFTTGDDATPPTYSAVSASPASPQTYPASVTFNATWTDNGAIDTVVIEHNFTGTWMNETLTGGPSFAMQKALPAGNLSWRQIANDTLGNRNDSMPYQPYGVSRATAIVNLTLEGVDGDIIVDEDTFVMINGSLLTGEGTLELLEDDQPIDHGIGDRIVQKNYTEPGTYTISVRHNQTQNYTVATENHTVTVRDITPPAVSLVEPFDGVTITEDSVTFSAIPSDNNATASCTLRIDGVDDGTNSTVTDDAPVTFTRTFTDGTYDWSVRCTDSAGNGYTTGPRSLTIAIIQPWIPTVATHNADGIVTGDVDQSDGITTQLDDGEHVEVTAWSDSAPANANISAVQAACEIDSSARGAVMSFQYSTGDAFSPSICTAPQDGVGTFTCDLYAQGVDTVAEINALQIRCVVVDGDGGPSANNILDYMQVQPDWTLIERPDFSIEDDDLHLPAGVAEGAPASLHVNVSNTGEVGGTLIVRFIDAMRDEVIAEPSVSIGNGSTVQVNATWTASIGPTNITVILDPADQVNEHNESNNNASGTMQVPAWHTYHGATENRFSILASGAQQYNWSNADLEGTIYIHDTDASVSMLNLQALTRTASGAFALDDLAEADAALDMTGWPDGIDATFSDQGALLGTRTFQVFGVPVPAVPVINSTVTDAFVTGILYDLDDDTNGGYDGEEDLVFLTRINRSQPGAFGTYDYEVTVPALLRNASGSDGSLALFIEVH